jgi:hypothetical protein
MNSGICLGGALQLMRLAILRPMSAFILTPGVQPLPPRFLAAAPELRPDCTAPLLAVYDLVAARRRLHSRRSGRAGGDPVAVP